MHVLVVGSKGQLGREIVRCLETGKSELGPLPDAFKKAKVTGVDIDTLDVSDLPKTIRFFDETRPDVVINCAAYTNVDGCESNPADAFRGNAIVPRNLAIAAERCGAKIVHLSTDYVFSGDEPAPRSEFDRPSPVSVYGKTKLSGEEFVKAFSSRWFIVRTAWLYGAHGKNFVKAILKRAREAGSVTVVNDQVGNPTNAADLAHHVLKIAATEEYGVYHCTGKGVCSWFEFAQKIVLYAGANAEVIPCTTEEYPSKTKRPAYSALEHTMLRLTVGDEMRPWEEALKTFLSCKENMD